MPIWKMERMSTVLAVWLPEPFTVATWILKSLTSGAVAPPNAAASAEGVTDISPL